MVYNLSLSYTQHPVEAEEITQDVFVKVFRHAASFTGQSSFKTWIYRIAINTALSQIKKSKKHGHLIALPEAQEISDYRHPGALMEDKEKIFILLRNIDLLPDNQRSAFILSYIRDLPQKEVADIMEVSVKSIEGLLQRGKKKLRKLLEKEYPERRKKKK